MTSNNGVTGSEWEDEPYGLSRILHEDNSIIVTEMLFKHSFTPYQRHLERAEYWHVAEGRLVGYLGVEPIHVRSPGSIMIAPGAWHWVGGHARVICTWIGDWLDASDIEVKDLP